ncbi:hypothetical protein EBZ38_03935 [bacterium]|nr:hypothetical protein [bacterium]
MRCINVFAIGLIATTIYFIFDMSAALGYASASWGFGPFLIPAYYFCTVLASNYCSCISFGAASAFAAPLLKPHYVAARWAVVAGAIVNSNK